VHCTGLKNEADASGDENISLQPQQLLSETSGGARSPEIMRRFFVVSRVGQG
jgi:hypothetical protein